MRLPRSFQSLAMTKAAISEVQKISGDPRIKKMSKDALLEIISEEIPAAYLESARIQLAQLAERIFSEKRLKYKKVSSFATPRRLTLCIDGLAEKQEDLVREVIGPPVNIAFDSAGRPQAAAIGFAQEYHFPLDALNRKKTEKGEYLCFRLRETGELTEKILPAVFVQIIISLSFPKTMVWEETKVRFARPIRNLLTLYGNKVIKFSLAGITSGKYSYGLFPLLRKKIEISTPVRYFPSLRNNFVLVDQKERREVIKKLATQIARKTEGEIYFDPSLLEEITYLVEYPTAVLGKFSSRFLNLPSEILLTCLVKKQKFFPILDREGNILPNFVGIRNGVSEHLEIVQEGYQSVLEARLSDAEFFFAQDRKTTLEEKSEKLKGIIFQEQLGTIYDKTKRINELANWLAKNLSTYQLINLSTVSRISLLCKADLVTEMVKEYTELEGTMGRIYALYDGEEEKVARGIEEHRWPLGSEGKLPETEEGALVSVVDKIDTLVGDFTLGLVPTGSADPYGLRRQGSGILRILKERNWSISLRDLAGEAFDLLPTNVKTNKKKEIVVNSILEFLCDRLETLLTEEKIPQDEISAVLAVGFEDVPATFRRARALREIRQLPDFEFLVVAFKRTTNILIQAEKAGIELEGSEVKEDLFEEEAERELWTKFKEIKEVVSRQWEEGNYAQGLREMVSLKSGIDKFFTEILVMAEREELRNNRLLVLKEVAALYLKIANLSLLVQG